MLKHKQKSSVTQYKIKPGLISLGLVFLLIEFFDEFHYGIQSAILPAMRSDLGFTYAQVGLLMGLPYMIGTFIEPILMLLGDTGLRKKLMVGGGITIVFSLFLLAGADTFPIILAAFIISFPASGAFVTLSQATLMDRNQGRETQTMARWTVAGSLGTVLGPLFLAGGFALALGWRWAFAGLGVLALILTVFLLPHRILSQGNTQAPFVVKKSGWFNELFKNLWETLRNKQLLRWVLLLQLSDLLLDVFTGYIALYLTDIVGLQATQTSLLLSILMVTSLLADLAVIPLLEYIPGRNIVRFSAILAVIVYSALLLVHWLPLKIVLLILTRFSTIGWYQVLQGEAYKSVPGKSGTVMAVNSLAGLAGGALIWLVGWTAGKAGLNVAMWLLLIGPLGLILFIPTAEQKVPFDRATLTQDE